MSTPLPIIVTVHDQYATPFLARLGAPRTADMVAAVGVWQRQESGGIVLGNNAWNLHVGPACPTNARAGIGGLNPSQRLRSSSIPGLIGNRYAGPGDKNVAIFDTPANGAAAAAANLLAWNDYGYPAVVRAARMGLPLAFLVALGASSWSSGRYGTRNGGANVLIGAFRRIRPTQPPAPVPAPPPVTGGQNMPAPIITVYPEVKIGSTPPGTRRWAASAPYDELPTLVGPGLYALSALVFFPGGGTPSGTFIQTLTVPNYLVRAADVTFVVTASPPTPLDPGSTVNSDPTLISAFAAKHGEDGTHYVADIIRSQLHPDPSRWYVDPGADQSVGDQLRVSDLYRKAKAEAFIAGQVSWGEERSYLGHEANILIDAGAVDPSAVLAILQGTAA